MNRNPHVASAEHLMNELGHFPRGLNDRQAALALEKYGANVLEETENRSMVENFITAVYHIYGLSSDSGCHYQFVMKETLDGSAIVVVIIINGVYWFSYRIQGRTALQALKAMTSPHCRVLRNAGPH